MTHRFQRVWPAVLLLSLFAVECAWPHPLGPFTIDHYSRIHVTGRSLSLRYIIDMAEIPTVEEFSRVDTDRDGKLSDAEKATYLQTKVHELAGNLKIEVNGRVLEWRIDSSSLTGLELVSGASNSFPTMRIVSDLSASIPTDMSINEVRYEDENFPGRAGWKEIVVTAAPDLRLIKSSVPAEDISVELTRYPSDALVAPPQFLQAEVTFGAAYGIDTSGGINLPALAVSLLATTSVLIARRKRKH
jgi:nickel/cobalt exporter